MNFIAARYAGGRVTAEGLPPLDLSLTRTPTEGAPLTLGLRPEALSLETGSVSMPARVAHVEHLGRDTVIYADATPVRTIESEGGNATFTLQAATMLAVSPDQSVTLRFHPSDLLVFAEDGSRLTPDRSLPVTESQGKP